MNASTRHAFDRGGRALIGGGIGRAVGGLMGHSADAEDKTSFCCSNLGSAIGTALGAAKGAGLGAGTADPTYVYPARLRVVLQPDRPPR
jgi:hypothetical protein